MPGTAKHVSRPAPLNKNHVDRKRRLAPSRLSSKTLSVASSNGSSERLSEISAGAHNSGSTVYKPRKLKNPLVSVVMTVYNEAHCVDQAIDTLLTQSYSRIELILVNNGSTDATKTVLVRYTRGKSKDSRVRIVDLPKNLGPGGGRNAGANVARGDILVFIDADMVFDKGYITGLIKPVVEGKSIGSFNDTELVKNTHNLWARSLCINRIIGNPRVSGVFRAVLRKEFLLVGGFDSSKGYFDDDLSKLGVSVVAHATCYHNNPETLSEVFRHSMWVGRSLMQNKSALRGYSRQIGVLLFAAVVLVTVSIYLLMASIIAWWVLLVAIILITWAELFFVFGLRRMFAEKDPLYLFSIPILQATRLSGYFSGAVRYILFKR